jgi:hypothetical protein
MRDSNHSKLGIKRIFQFKLGNIRELDSFLSELVDFSANMIGGSASG